MAAIAGFRVSRFSVVRHRATQRGGALILCIVTVVTCRLGDGHSVTICGGVAQIAGGCRVHARKCPPGGGVIKGSIGPVNRIVAGIAGLRVPVGNVIRNIAAQGLRVEPIGSVAGAVAGRAVYGVTSAAGVTLVAVGDHPGRSHLVVAR